MLHMLEPTGWTEGRLEQLKVLWAEGQSAAAIAAALGGGLTRNAVIGKVHRIKLPPRYSVTPKTHATPRMNRNNGKGQPKAAAIRHRVEMQQAPPQPVEPLPEEEGVDCTHLLGIMEINEHTCKWPYGDPLDKETFGFCGQPSIEGSPYCHKHHRLAFKVLA